MNTATSTKTASNKQRQSESVKDRILDAARELYAEYGPTDVTFEEIAEAADVSRRTIYRYFKNKRSLIQALVDEQALGFLEKMSADLIGLSDDFEKLLEDYIVYLAIKGPQEPGREILRGKAKSLHGGEFYFSSRLLHQNWQEMIAVPFEKAVARGELRSDIKTEHLLEWIGRVVFTFVQFPKEEGELRTFLRTFVLPSLKPAQDR